MNIVKWIAGLVCFFGLWAIQQTRAYDQEVNVPMAMVYDCNPDRNGVVAVAVMRNGKVSCEKHELVEWPNVEVLPQVVALQHPLGE